MILSLIKDLLYSFPLFYNNELTRNDKMKETIHFALIYNSKLFYVDFFVHTSLYLTQLALHEEVKGCCSLY